MFGEIIDLNKTRSRKDQVEVQVRKFQKRTESDAFLIITAAGTEHFVQFARVDDATILLDIPLVALAGQQQALARDFFDRLTKSYGSERVGMATAGGSPEAYQMSFTGEELEDAADVVTAFFDLVYQTPSGSGFIFEEN
jgi:hypothetical protein